MEKQIAYKRCLTSYKMNGKDDKSNNLSYEGVSI